MRRTAAVASVGCLLASAACMRRETPEDARARTAAVFLRSQITSLEKLVAQAESQASLGTEDKIAIGISEGVVNTLVDASLPRTVPLGKRAQLTLESAQAFFRGNRGALLLQATLQSADLAAARATVELAGMLKDFAVADGQLTAHVTLLHFRVVSSGSGLGGAIVERLVKENLEAIEQQVPPLVIPVRLEERIRIAGLKEGPVTAQPGELPLTVSVAQVIPNRERLWILLEARAGPWKSLPAVDPGGGP